MPAWKKTQKGRVVHDRKIHLFTKRDLIRIGSQTATLILRAPFEEYNAIHQLLVDFVEVSPGVVFGGGEFGGGGATRDFGSGNGSEDLPNGPRVIMIVETTES